MLPIGFSLSIGVRAPRFLLYSFPQRSNARPANAVCGFGAKNLPATCCSGEFTSPWLIKPEDLLKILQSPKGEKPLLIHVGFHVLYSQGHIPGSEYIGPPAQPEMLEKLRKRVESLPRGKFIVLYCGCCPWNQCPTVRPAFEALHSMGFTQPKVLYIADNFGRNWIYKGFPTEKVQ